MYWKNIYKDKLVSLVQAAAAVRDGDMIFSPLCTGIPYLFYDALADRAGELNSLSVSLGCAQKPMRIYDKEFNGKIQRYIYFLSKTERNYIKSGSFLSYQPMHLSVTTEDKSRFHRANVLAVSGRAPDENGMICLGTCPIDAALLDSAELVIVQVNNNMANVAGTGTMLPAERVSMLIDAPEEIKRSRNRPITDTDVKIAERIAEMVPDGACLQLGVGGIGAAVGKFLKDKKELGIHTEMYVNSMTELIKCGAVTNSRKELCRGKTVYGFACPDDESFDLMNNNPDFETRPFSWVNDPRVIAQNDNVISVNSALQIDLTGQVCAESIGITEFSGTGGQADFVRGARWSRGGKSFIAMPSSRVDKNGELKSKISLSLLPGSAVTTPRADVQYVATEYGVVDLCCESLCNRAKKLISIAHPDFRDQLRFEAKKAGLII